MVRLRKTYRIVPGTRRGEFLLPDGGTKVYLNPLERTFYHLFLNHPEGISTDALPLHKKEISYLYEHESVYDDKRRMTDKVEALCSEDKTSFYTTVSRIKKKLVAALGARKAAPYLIKRDRTGLYKTRATPSETSHRSENGRLGSCSRIA